jgi:hypothetical protein
MGYLRRIGVASALFAAACSNDPVEWGNVSYRGSQLGDPDTRNAIMSANLPSVAGAKGACELSVRTSGTGADLFRAWWSSRPDSSVVLSMQHSPDRGVTWDPPVEIENRDRGRRGCARPAPGIFFDSLSGNLHLVYFIEAADGAGVFFAHSMDRGGLFHSPVPVVYGTNPSVAGVAGHGDSVVVVFEDPNSTTARIGIVLSRTTGHIFEQRAQVTPDEASAVEPWVALRHDTVQVWWKALRDSASSARNGVGTRAGIWR